MVDVRNTFVFVVCGGKEYITTLNIALRFLKVFSKSDVVVITDSSRNEASIECDHLIDVATDASYNNHQASVFLKTSLHRYLDMDKGKYCYLDSDILALTNKVDEVFEQKRHTIGFCADNITLDLFSPYAVNCGCYEKARSNEQQLLDAQKGYALLLKEWEAFKVLHKGDVLDALIASTNASKIKNIVPLTRFAIEKALPFFSSATLKGYRWVKKEKVWKNCEGEIVLYPVISYYDYIAEQTGFSYEKSGAYWYDGAKQDVCVPRCSHLHQQISKLHGILIKPADWQHWNGGVFLFDKSSVEFLEYWHKETLSIFNKPDWKTRDQGTLALTVWKFGLQDQSPMDSRFNYILDYFKPGLDYSDSRGFTKDGFITNQHPDMVHVYHRFGDETWNIWQYLKNFGISKGVIFDE